MDPSDDKKIKITSFFLAGDDSTTTSPDRETLKQQRGIMVYTFLKNVSGDF